MFMVLIYLTLYISDLYISAFIFKFSIILQRLLICLYKIVNNKHQNTFYNFKKVLFVPCEKHQSFLYHESQAIDLYVTLRSLRYNFM